MDQKLPRLFDTIMCDRDFPELSLAQSSMGTIIECHGDEAYEVEFSDDAGVPTLTTVITLRNSVLEWRDSDQTWILKDFFAALKKAFQSLEVRRQNFVDACMAETVLPKDITTFIDAWSETHLPHYRSLREVLGMTQQEFELWESNQALLPKILEARQKNIGLASIP
ncbi:MAG: DUF4926 domain-containing protein [Cyanobacteria bacterium P01_D01_bin.73]